MANRQYEKELRNRVSVMMEQCNQGGIYPLTEQLHAYLAKHGYPRSQHWQTKSGVLIPSSVTPVKETKQGNGQFEFRGHLALTGEDEGQRAFIIMQSWNIDKLKAIRIEYSTELFIACRNNSVMKGERTFRGQTIGEYADFLLKHVDYENLWGGAPRTPEGALQRATETFDSQGVHQDLLCFDADKHIFTKSRNGFEILANANVDIGKLANKRKKQGGQTNPFASILAEAA